jgi:hypothetical protein
MATNLTAPQTAIKLIADATTDSIKAAGDSTTAAKIAEYELLSDVIALIPQIGDIPTEASALGEGCVLLGTSVSGTMITFNWNAFNKFMALQAG